MMMIRCIGYRISEATLAARTAEVFEKRYETERNVMTTTMMRQQNARLALKVPKRAYVHPNSDPFMRPSFSFHHKMLNVDEMMGPEQVSAHYENLATAKRYAILLLVGPMTLYSLVSFGHGTLLVQTLSANLFTYLSMTYFFYEGKKNFRKAFNLAFYKQSASQEVVNMETYWAENIENRVRKLMARAKSQIQFIDFLQVYNPIKEKTFINFAIAEQQALKNHLYHRAVSLLKEAENIENNNKNILINEVLKEAINSVDQAYSTNKAEIDAAFFELALTGIANNKMEFKNDPILPYVSRTIEKIIHNYDSIPKQEREKKLHLSQANIETLRSFDARARDEYLNAEPRIDPTLKSVPVLAQIMQTWGVKKR